MLRVTNAKGKYIIFKKQIYFRIPPLYIYTKNRKMSHNFKVWGMRSVVWGGLNI